jgi:hypothetical protein
MKTELSPEKSLEIITQMIEESKQSYKHHSFYFLLWGWLMIAAALGQYVLLEMENEYHFLPWMVFSIIGGVVAGIKGSKDKKVHKTFADKVMSFTWFGFVVTMIITLIAVVPSNPNPFVLLLAGLATFITGGITQFKGFIIGGIIFWIGAIVTFQMDIQTSLLVYSLAMFLGYIVPGYALKRA